MKNYKFPNKLIEGLIKSRPNRFIMMVDIKGHIIKCHCPSTGRIGNIIFSDIPCLLSKARNKDRKTPYTVEAISFDAPKNKFKSWIGINQTKANKYIDFLLANNQLSRIIKGKEILREQKLGKARIDFKIDNKYLEVKTPLISLPTKNKSLLKPYKFNSFERLIKHFNELSKNLNSKSRAIILLCCIYDAPVFSPPRVQNNNQKIMSAARQAHHQGLETWQINLKITPSGVKLIKYFKLKLF